MDDLISKRFIQDALIEKISNLNAEGATQTARELIRLKKFVDGLTPPASAEAVQGWIPCSERLPEEFYVLCCDNHGEMIIANLFACDDSDTGFSAESEDCYMYNCVAWMPLPKPYREEDEV